MNTLKNGLLSHLRAIRFLFRGIASSCIYTSQTAIR